MSTKYVLNLSADENDVLRRFAMRIQQSEGIVLSKEQIVFAALEALQKDAHVRQALKKRVASELLKVPMEPE